VQRIGTVKISGRVFRSLKDFCMPKSAQNFWCEHCSFQLLVHWCCNLWKFLVGHTEIRVFTCIYLHQQILFAKMLLFPSPLHVKLNTLEKFCPFKSKCTVKCWKLNMRFLDWLFYKKRFLKGSGTILKAIAFQQCTAT